MVDQGWRQIGGGLGQRDNSNANSCGALHDYLRKIKRGPFRLLALAAMALLALAFFSPIWWVALTAPQYPPDAFPDGIRIEFHFNGVMNGCHTRPRTEIDVDTTKPWTASTR